MEEKINSFSKYVLRTPLFPINLYKKLTYNYKVSEEDLIKLCKDPIISEALFLASPSFHGEIEKWTDGYITDKKKRTKIKHSVLKYISRMSSRCTPFGLFAGCSVGSFGNGTCIKIKEPGKNARNTRLDMNLMVAFSQNLVKIKSIREQVLFFPNTSIYQIGEEIRYIEYNVINGKRHHQIVGVNSSEYIRKILSQAKKGALLVDLAKTLVDEEITIDESSEFIEDLVASQILISELEPSISGPDFMEQTRSILQRINGTEEVLEILAEVDQKITLLDKNLGNDINHYSGIIESVKKLGIDFDMKYVFQTDMVVKTDENLISKEVLESVKKGFILLNKLTPLSPNSSLSNFIDAFYNRFEDSEVPLALALDTELGIGYGKNEGNSDINPLIDDLVISPKQPKQTIKELKLNPTNLIFQKKLLQAYKNNSYVLKISDQDFQGFESNWETLPDTMNVSIEIVELNGEQKIKFNGISGSSAANLFARFSYGDEKLENLIKNIIDFETKKNQDKLLAEIIHLPESRVGNILMRPELRKFEIPYLSKSIKNPEYQLPIEDLYISIRKRKYIFLRSRKYNKEVVPRLTNAHNYSNKPLPLYHFLCDLQTQLLRKSLGISLGVFSNNHEFLPRIEYENLIFSEATWNLNTTHVKLLLENKNNDSLLLTALKTLRNRLNIPQYVKLIERDNELLVNLDNLTSARMFIDIVRKKSSFQIKEFLHDENGIVKNQENHYVNQIIIPFYIY